MISKKSLLHIPFPRDVLIILGVYCLILGWLYGRILHDVVVQVWMHNPDYSHGFLIPPLALYFLWQRRAAVSAATVTLTPSWWGLVCLCAGIGLRILGDIGGELFLLRFSFLIILAALVLFHTGWSFLWVIRFPLVYLLFMIPMPGIVYQAIAFRLQLITARFSTDSLQLLYIPVYRDGNIISLTSTSLEVVEACSGIRSLLSLLALAVAFGELTQPNLLRKLLIIVSTIPIAIFANATRIISTGILSTYFDPKMAEGFFHTFSGWLIFIIAFGVLGIEGWLFTVCSRYTSKSEGLRGLLWRLRVRLHM